MSFDHEKLDVYRLAVEFIAWTGELLDTSLKKTGLSAAKHLEEASQSIANNIAEGNGQTLTCGPLPIPRHRARICARMRSLSRCACCTKTPHFT